MRTRAHDLPLPVILMAIGAAAMLVPAAHGFATGDDRVGRAFLYSGGGFLLVAAMVGVATAGYRPRDAVRSQLNALVGAYLLLPLMLAVPMAEAVPDTTFHNAWFEMVSSFTTTGATLYDAPDRLPASVHLWRASVGWLGGFFVLVTAAAILAPLNLGGFEVLSPATVGLNARSRGPIDRRADPTERLVHHTLVLAPVYGAITLALWVGLLIAGDRPLVALCHAMGTLSTSGISPVGGLAGGASGLAGEALVFLGLLFAVTRRSMPGSVRVDRAEPIWRDPEVRLAATFVVLVPLALFVRHWLGAITEDRPDSLATSVAALWGSAFTVLSFLTTTGFESAGWTEARIWSGIEAPGLLLLGLAMMGGGVATTAGGVRLLRVYALFRHGQREMERMVHPRSVGGDGPQRRRLRNEGAYLAFIAFMLFALSLGVINMALALGGLEFERALVLSVGALTTTGQLAGLAVPPVAGALAPQGWGGLDAPLKTVLALAMILGRLETLALLVLLVPPSWRR
jgi:trk system potassium uptake protein TrkH